MTIPTAPEGSVTIKPLRCPRCGNLMMQHVQPGMREGKSPEDPIDCCCTTCNQTFLACHVCRTVHIDKETVCGECGEILDAGWRAGFW